MPGSNIVTPAKAGHEVKRQPWMLDAGYWMLV
jgi:hypothetical protein